MNIQETGIRMKIVISAANNRITDKGVTSRDIKIHCSSFIHRCFLSRIETFLGKQSLDHVTTPDDASSGAAGGHVRQSLLTSKNSEKNELYTERLWQALLNAHSPYISNDSHRMVKLCSNSLSQPTLQHSPLEKNSVYEMRIKIFIVVHVTLLWHSCAASHSFAMQFTAGGQQWATKMIRLIIYLFLTTFCLIN